MPRVKVFNQTPVSNLIKPVLPHHCDMAAGIEDSFGRIAAQRYLDTVQGIRLSKKRHPSVNRDLLAERILAVLSSDPTEGMTASQVEEILNDDKVNSSSISSVLSYQARKDNPIVARSPYPGRSRREPRWIYWKVGCA